MGITKTPTDVKSKTKGAAVAASGPVTVVLDESTAKNLFLALVQALNVPTDKKKKKKKKKDKTTKGGGAKVAPTA